METEYVVLYIENPFAFERDGEPKPEVISTHDTWESAFAYMEEEEGLVECDDDYNYSDYQVRWAYKDPNEEGPGVYIVEARDETYGMDI